MKQLYLSLSLLAAITALTVVNVGIKAQDGSGAGLNNAGGGGGGGGPVLNGNAYDSYKGTGVFGHTFPRGTITASDPFVFSQTWNNSAVTFHGFTVAISGTPVTDFDITSSTYFRVMGGPTGTTCFFGVQPNNGGGCVLSVSSTDSKLYTNGEVNNGNGGYSTTITRFPFQSSRLELDTPTVRQVRFGAQSEDTSAVTIMNGNAPTLTSGWGTGATIAGTGSVGRITIGTTPSASGVLTFLESWSSAPHCDFNNETSGVVPTKVVPTTALVTVTATLVAADKVSYHCVGF